MVDLQDTDPFLWDVDRLVIEFRKPDPSWEAPPGSKMPDPKEFTKSLRKHDVDGDTLLGYDFDGSNFGGRKIFNLMWKDLGVTDDTHEPALYAAVLSLQARSSRYQAWRTNPDDTEHIPHTTIKSEDTALDAQRVSNDSIPIPRDKGSKMTNREMIRLFRPRISGIGRGRCRSPKERVG